MGKLFREDGSPVKRADPDYHKYYQRHRKSTNSTTNIKPNQNRTPNLSRQRAIRRDYIPKPKKEILLELRDSMIKKRMAKKLIKIIEDMI